VRCVPLVRDSIRAAARVRRVRLRNSNYVKIIPTHMMIREIIPGRQQTVRRCPLYNMTVAGTLISSVKGSVALTSAEVIDLAGSVD